jgi:hypothetical protein
LAVPAAEASDPVAVYALVDRVVLEPDEKNPELIQIWGTFSMGKKRYQMEEDRYHPPVRGYLYFKLKPKQEDLCRREWADVKKAAGGKDCVGFGFRWELAAKVRPAGEKPDAPDVYPLHEGLFRMRAETDYPPVARLYELPRPAKPADGASVAPGAVTLVAGAVRSEKHRGASYVFELEDPSGRKESSGELGPDEGEARWTPKLTVAEGGSYTWRVWAVQGDWKGPVATSRFTVKNAQ